MMINKNSCMVCYYPISDPVCTRCYIKHAKILLKEFNSHSIYNDDILKRLEKRFLIETMNDIQCILCNKDTISVCRYCYLVIIRKILLEFNFSDDLIEEFGYNPMYDDDYFEYENNLCDERDVKEYVFRKNR